MPRSTSYTSTVPSLQPRNRKECEVEVSTQVTFERSESDESRCGRPFSMRWRS